MEPAGQKITRIPDLVFFVCKFQSMPGIQHPRSLCPEMENVAALVRSVGGSFDEKTACWRFRDFFVDVHYVEIRLAFIIEQFLGLG